MKVVEQPMARMFSEPIDCDEQTTAPGCDEDGGLGQFRPVDHATNDGPCQVERRRAEIVRDAPAVRPKPFRRRVEALSSVDDDEWRSPGCHEAMSAHA